jgi:hypothetical protein
LGGNTYGLVARQILSGFQNFIGTHYRIYNKKVISQVIANLSGLARNHELFLETLSKILLMLDIAMILLRPPFVQMAIPNVENVPNYNQIILEVLLLRNQLILFNWNGVVSDFDEVMIRGVTQNVGLGNNLIEYYRDLRVVYLNHGGTDFLGLCPLPTSATTAQPKFFSFDYRDFRSLIIRRYI